MRPSSLHLISLAAVLVALSGPARAQSSGPSDGSLPAEFLKEMDNGGGAAIPPPPSGPPSATGAPQPAAPAPPPAQAPPAAQMPAAPTPPPPQQQAMPQPAAPQHQGYPGGYVDPNLGATAVGTAVSNEEYVYDPTGRRDPFKPYRVIRTDTPAPSQRVASPGDNLEPLQRLELESLSIVGILWDVRQPRALVKDVNGNLHTLVRNTKVGRNNGYVAAIREGEIVVIETVEEEGRAIKRTKVLELKRAEK